MKKDEKNEETKKSSGKSIGTMNVILIIVGIFLVAFTLKMISLFETYGMVPDTLINCVFVALAGECGIMGWIKLPKRKTRIEDGNWRTESGNGKTSWKISRTQGATISRWDKTRRVICKAGNTPCLIFWKRGALK